MKNLVIYSLIVLTLLLQSCYSYREINIDQNLVEGKKYKIKQFNKYEKVRLLSSTDSTITVINSKKKENTIARKDIKTIKKEHFSIAKTALLPIGVGVAVVGVAVVLVATDGNFIH